MYKLARLRHDDPPRIVENLNLPPETVVLESNPRGTGKGVGIPISKEWRQYLSELNSADAYRWLLTPHAAWVNKEYKQDGNPVAESISFGGNIVVIDMIHGNYGRLRSFYYAETPPYSAQAMNYARNPQFISKVTCINRNGKIQNPGSGLDVYFPIIRKTELWVQLSLIEWFPSVPRQVQVNWNTIPWLNARATASTSSPVTGAWLPLQTVVVYHYAVRGSSVWGYTDKGWIALLYYPNPTYIRYFTSWRMETVPPIPPSVV